ncbi:MAG: OsmC family peroxiredoxin [Aquaticitalea sp.]
MKFTRTANAQWKGGGKDGKGTLTTESKVLDKAHYAYKTRFEDAKGTNPEELIGAAHAGCYSMQLSFLLGEEGFTPTELNTKADVTFEDGSITKIVLTLEADIPNIVKDTFDVIAKKAKEVCPVSKLLKAEIVLNATLK